MTKTLTPGHDHAPVRDAVRWPHVAIVLTVLLTYGFELFNIFNRANYNTATSNLTSALFGQSTTLQPNINAPSRQAEFAIRFQF